MTPTTESLEHIAESLRPLAVPLASLTLDPANARRHPERNLGAVEASLRLYGQRKPVVVRRQGMIVEAGNGTVEAARRLGWGHVAAVIVDDDPITATGYSIADNRTAELAEWDDEALSKLLLELEKGDVDLDALGWNERELDDLLEGLDGRPGGEPQGEDAGPTEPPEEPVSQPGEVYALGPHRLLCGDSTDAEAVARLMAGEKARLMATDPPYLVDYDGTNHGYLTPEQRERAARGGSYGGKRWDDYNEASATLWRDFLEVALPHLEDDAPIYQWHASRRQALVEAAWQENGLLVHQTIVWVKKRPVLTRSHFLWTYEPCFYGWKQGFQPERDRRPPPDTRNVWEIGTDTLDVKGVHPTQKPLEVCRWPIRWHLRRGELCYEPFGGSGTCVIAAAMEGRRCYAIELDFVGTVGNAARVVAALHQGKKRLLFADSRSMVEELGQHLRSADVQAAIIHSSLAFSERQAAEQAFAEWEQGVIVSTSAMELGIDIGDLDHVLQVGAPTTVSSFLQRMGRTGRRPGTRPNTTFLTLERDNSLSVLVAAGILRLWRRGWVEPIEPDPWSVHLLAHQLLALAVQERGVPKSDWWAWIGAAAPFRGITPEERESVLEHMLAKDILSTDGVRLTLGDEGQKRYGRRHFLELYAVFRAPPTLTVMHGSTELGTIDPLLLLSREGRPLVLALGGRSWRVGHVDWSRGRCVVEPSAEPGRSTWQGEPKWLSQPLAAAIREVLLGTGEDPGWTPRAARTIANLRAEHAYVAQAPDALHERPDGTIEWWTFAGGRANNLLAAVLEESLDGKIVANSLRIKFEAEAARSSQAIYGAVRACELDERTARRLGAQRARGPLSKFQPCLPPALEERFVARRIFDVASAGKAAGALVERQHGRETTHKDLHA